MSRARSMCVFLFVGFASISNVFAAETDRAEVFFKAGKWEMARVEFVAALPKLQGDEKAKAMGRIGYCWERQSKFQKAVEIYRQVLAMEDVGDVQTANAYLRLGYSLRLLTKNREALVPLRKAAEVEGASANQKAEALLYRAWAYGVLEEPDNAIEVFRQVEKVSDVHENYVASARLSIGRTLQEMGKFREAMEVYQSVGELKVVAQTNRARARVYALECQALLEGDNPFHIQPYVTKVDKTSARVYWVSQGDISAGEVTMIVNGKTRRGQVKQTPLSQTICQLHTATFDGLRAGTRYEYQVQCGDEKVGGSFRTAPTDKTPFRFSLIGDTQSYYPALQPLLDNMGDEKTDFTLHVGDLVDRGNMWGEWKAGLFDPGREYFKDSVFWPAYGNHDGGPYFGPLFGQVPNYWYSYNWGNAHFIVLDSYGAGSGGVGRAKQLAWLKQDLENNDKPWTFVALHVPMMATMKALKRFGENDFLPLMEKHGVDIIFSGHHPHYRRYRPIARNGRKPILHITSGGGGGPVGGYMPSPLLSLGINVNHYCVIEIDGNRLTLVAKAISGAVIDRYELVKTDGRFQDAIERLTVDTEQGKKIVSLYQELLTDRTYEMRLGVEGEPQAGGKAHLVLDLNNLPRGSLDLKSLPEGAELEFVSIDKSPWKIERQSFPLSQGKLVIQATAPKNATVNKGKGVVFPAAEIVMQLKVGSKKYEPVTATARLSVLAK